MMDPVFDVAPAAEEVNGPSSQIPPQTGPRMETVVAHLALALGFPRSYTFDRSYE
jgi:hypothetical protein